MQRLFAIWHKILEFGCLAGRAASERRRIRLSNQLSMVGVGVSSTYALVFLSWGWTELAFPLSLFVLAYAGFPLLNRVFQGKVWVRHLFIWTIFIEIGLFCGIMGRESGIPLLLVSAVATPFAILNFAPKRPPLIYITVPLLTYLALEFWFYDVVMPMVLTEFETRVLNTCSMTVAILTNFLILAFFHYSNSISERSLSATIEHLHRSNRQIEEQQIQLANTSRFAAIGELSGSVAHEINNPLSIILGYTEQNIRLLQASKLDHLRMVQNSEKILRTITRITKIVIGLQKLSRDGADDSFETHDFRDLIKDATSICYESLAQAGINLKIHMPPEACLVFCRPVQISQVILNLILNARDAIEAAAEKWIELRLVAVGTTFQLTVQDSGQITDSTVLHKIGQPFFTTKPPGKGTGLGISISRRIIVAHYGTLELDRLANTTSFQITLPKYRQQGAALGAFGLDA